MILSFRSSNGKFMQEMREMGDGDEKRDGGISSGKIFAYLFFIREGEERGGNFPACEFGLIFFSD